MAILNYKIYYYLFLILTGIVLTSCSEKAKDIFNPTSENIIEFSLSKRTYKIEEVVKRQSQIKVDSGKYLLKFTTDEIRKDTTIDAFNADFFQMHIDTVFYVLIGDSIDAQMIVRRDSVGVEEAEFESGTMTLRFTNYTTKPAFFQLILPGFTRTIGSQIDTLKLGGEIPAGETVNFVRDVANYLYKQPLNQPFGTSRPGFWLRGIIFVQGGSFGDSVRVFTEVNDLRFKRIRGRFKPLNMGDKEQTLYNSLSSDISEFIQKVTFDSISVRLNAFTSIDFPIRLNYFQVKGKFNSGREPINLRFGDNDYIDTTILSNGLITLNFNNLNTNINEFLSHLPDSLTIKSNIILNPDYKSGEVLSNDSISFSTRIDAWSRFTVRDAEWTDTFDLDISQDARNKMKNAKGGTVIIYSENQVPFELKLVGLVTDSNYNPLFYLTKDEIAQNDTMVSLHGAFVNSIGEVIAPSYQTIKINLTQEDIEKLSRGYKLIQRFSLSTTNQNVSEVSAKQKIDLRITGIIKIELTSDDF